MTHRCNALLCFVMALAVVGSFVPTALAVSGSLEVTVYGVQKSGEKELLVGARVVLTHVDKQYPDTALITNMSGQVVFPTLPPGPGYLIDVSMPGYGKVRIDAVITGGQVLRKPVALTEQITEIVKVIGSGDVVELEGAEAVTTISDEFLQDLPVLGREYQNVLSMAPGVQDDDGDGNPNVHGARERDFQMAVDGVSNVDPLTGEFQSYINPDAIEEIEIIDSGADASYGGAVGGFGRIITKSGGNEFEGSFNLFFRDSAFDNDRGGGGDPLDYGLFQPSFLFSGPIIRDHVWFFISHEYVDAQAPIDLIGGGNFVQSQEAFRHSDKFTWQVTPKNKLQIQFNADPLKVSPAAVNSLIPPASGVFYEQGGPTYTGKWTAPLTPNFFWEATIAFSDIEYKWWPYDTTTKNTCLKPREGFDEEELAFLMCDDVVNGGARTGVYFNDHDDVRQRWTYRIDGEQFLSDFMGGDHRLRFGGSMERVNFQRKNFFRDRLFFSRNRNSEGGLDLNNPNNTGPVGSMTRQIYNPVDSRTKARGNYYAMWITDSFTPLSNLNVKVGVRLSREELSSNGYKQFDPEAERAAWSAFLDECVTSGRPPSQCMRAMDGQQLFTVHPADVPPPPNPDGTGGGCRDPEASIVNQWQCGMLELVNDPGRPRDVFPRISESFDIINTDIEPRISVSWDPFDDGKTKVAAFFGRVHGTTPLAPITDEAAASSTNAVQNVNGSGQLLSSSSSSNQVLSAYTVRVLDRNLKRQYSDEWGVSIEREVAPETSMRLRYIDRKYNGQLQDVDMNHAPVFYDQAIQEYEGDRPCEQIGEYADCTGWRVFVPSPLDPTQGTFIDIPDGVPDLQVVSPFFNNVYVISNLNDSKYNAIILELTRRYYQNWELQTSYTYSRALGDAEDYAQGLGDDRTNEQDEYGYLSYDVRHFFRLNGRVFIPAWGGFRIGGSINWRSGTPYSIIERSIVVDYPTRLDRGASGEIYDNIPGSTDFTFQLQSPRLRYPTGRRNDQRNEGLWNVDVNLQKEFHIKDTRVTAQFDTFNLLNDTTMQIFAVNRVEVGELGGGKVYRFFPVAIRRQGRQFQLSLKVNF